DLPVSKVFSYFETPRDWARLYGFAGTIEDRGNGWVAVPLKSFPFPLVARNTEVEANRLVRWTFRGFWRGEGEVRFTGDENHVTVEGFERISIRWLGFFSPAIERPFLEKRFRFIWELGWRRLREMEGSKNRAGRSASDDH
ncbi:MAG: hypothetical protein R3338_09550, partial [Thermoanaerobaculia bacterium]|nr:hypothetical protein [Thermoanaerobaculia bacterium]